MTNPLWLRPRGRVKKTAPDLYRRSEKAYESYRTRLVKPLRAVLKTVNKVVVLVDVTSLLAGNTAMKNGHRVLIDEILEVLSPGFSMLGRPIDMLKVALSGGHLDDNGIDKLAIVATKADKVLKPDLDNRRLLGLLRTMLDSICERHRHRASGLKVEYFHVAATKSARNVKDDPSRKRGILEGDASESVYDTSRLPDSWPPSWEPGTFSFPDVEPSFPDDEQQAPDHIEMNRVVEFLLDFS